MPTSAKIYINGYGAPKDPVNDGNLSRYLGAVKSTVENFVESNSKYGIPNSKYDFTLYLAGGFTNRTDLSEARAMQMWFEHHGLPKNVRRVILIEESTTGRDNLVLFTQTIEDPPMTYLTLFFWEYSRRFQMEFLARHILAKMCTYHQAYEFIGVPFDARSMKLVNRAKEYLLKFPLLVLAWYFPFINKLVVRPIRERHIAKCRKEAEK
jgi:hypothetical protein